MADKDFIVKNGLVVGGNITATGTVDGRDVAADGTKLDGIEALADVTDVTNVAAAGALMDSEVTNLAQVKAFSAADYATAAQGTLATNALPKAGGTMTGNLTLGDNVNLYLGDSSDASLVFDGTDTTLTSQGELILNGQTGITIDGNNVTNQPTLVLSDMGAGVTGILLKRATGGYIVYGESMDHSRPLAIAGTNKSLGFKVAGNQGNASYAAFDFNVDANASSQHPAVMGVRSPNNNALLFQGEQSDSTVVFSVDYDGNVATSGTVDGRDVATDGTKLDGIETGATADQTAAQLLTAIKTVDGAGSGLDADLLDGLSSASFLNQNTTGSAATLTTARAIEVSGAVTGTANFDGSAAINIVTTATSDPTITLGGDLSGAVTLTNLTSGTLTATVGTLNQNTTGSAATLTTTRAIEVSGAVTGTANFDGSADINIVTTNTADPTITLAGDLSGAVTLTNLASGTLTATVGTLNQNTTGSAATLTTARAIQVSGAVTGTANFDGSAAINIVTTNTADPTLTLAGDLSGTTTFTNLGNASLTATVGTLNQDTTGSAATLTTTRAIEVSGAVTGTANFDGSAAINIVTTATNDPVITLTGAVTGSGTMTNLGSVSITTTNTADPVLTLTGDASGSATFTNLGNASLAVVVADDSHNHSSSSGNFTVGGNLVVNGTTVTVNATTITIDDPIITLGGDTTPGADDNKDRGIEFKWHNGSVAKVGFFGFDDSTGYLTFIPDATNTSEVFSGSVGDIQATNFRGALIGNASTATTLATTRAIALTGAVTGTANFDGSAGISITTTATSDPTLTLAGDATGSATFTNLGNATLTVAVVDDSHNHSISTISDEHRLFNNMGDNHSTNTDFNAVSNFGARYISGATNGPGTGSSQFYGFTLGLGNEYALSQYALQLAIPRYILTDKYLSFRSREGGNWSSWYKINAGQADTLTTARTIGGVSFNGSANINLPGVNAAGNQSTTGNAATATALQTARTINGVSFNGTANITVAATDATKLPLAGGTMTGQIISTRANSTATGGGQIYLNGATGNRIDFNQAGVAAPTFTTRSAGTKIVLYPAVAAASADFALGIEGSTLWSSVPATSSYFKWYGGTTTAMTLTGTGILTATTFSGSGASLTALNGTNISTGTVAAARVATLNQNTTGSAATLTTARTINGVSFNGSANITVADDTKAPVKRGTSTITNAGWTTVCTVLGDAYGSSVRMSVAGTGPSTVISSILDIVVNHSLDIMVTSQTGTYTILYVKIVTDNNEDFAVQLKTNSANNLPVNIEVFPLNNETVTFTSTNPYTGATLEHECMNGGFASSSAGGAAHEFYSNGTKLIAADDNQALHDTNALSISGHTITLTKGDNTTETVVVPDNADLLDGKDHTNFGATLATYGTTGSASGRIRCTAPFATNSAHMFQVTVSLYSGYVIHNYVVGGYMYDTPNQWHAPTCIYSGGGSPDIVVGRDTNGKAYISIANGNYTGVRVHNMTLGYQTSVADTYDPWTITVNAATENSVTPTISKTWHSTNDGAGSGLDADLLDGNQATAFATSAQGTLATNALPKAGGTMTGNTIVSNYGIGNVGLYSATVFQNVFSMGAAYVPTAAGARANSYGILWTHSNNADANGKKVTGHHATFMQAGITQAAIGPSIWCIGNITAYSDIRVKENLELIPDAISKVKQISGYTYDRTDIIDTGLEEDAKSLHNPTNRHVGLIAQELIKVLPEAVTGGPSSSAGSEDDHYSVAYGNVVALLVEAIKEQQTQIEQLKKDIEELKV